jgi:hypothetical protein
MSKENNARTKRDVILEWGVWAQKNLAPGQQPDGHHAMLFFQYLQTERTRLLPPGSGDHPWQTVHGWLLSEQKVKD